MDPDLSDASLQEEDEDEESFHGWGPEEVPSQVVVLLPSDRSPLSPSELSRPFKPQVFRKIPSYKYLESSEGISGFSTTTLLKTGGSSSSFSSSSSVSSLGGPVAIKKKGGGSSGKAVNVSITPNVPSKREWRPSSQYFKPLQMGWVREVILPSSGCGESISTSSSSSSTLSLILYHSPPINSKKHSKTFKTLGEVEAFLNQSNSGLSSLNFSFRKEIMGAPPGQEIVHLDNEPVEIFPPKPEPPPHPPRDPKKTTSPKVPENPGLPPTTMKLKIKNTLKPDESKQTKKPEVNTRVINLDGDTNNLSSILSPMLKDSLTKARTSSESSRSSKKQNCSPFMNWPSSVSVSPAGGGKPTLRPKVPDHGPCSIHCGAGGSSSGFPSLSCSKCNSLFHPLCVGLGDGHSYAGYDFVCSACAPPGEKENSAPNKKKNGPAVSFSPVVTPSRVNNSSANNNNSNTSSSNPRSGVTVNRAHGPGQSQSSTQQERHHKAPPPPNLPLRPIETQSVVNIAGNKYLVVPQGGKAPERPTKRKSHQGNSSSSGGSHANSHNIPVLLKPYSGSDQLPSFEVEETSDGRLQLLPISSTGLDKVLKRKKKEPEEEVGESSPDTKRFCRDFISNLSSAYYALVHVFKYLSTQERIQVSRVCRLWRDLVLHPSLWKSISLKGTKVYDWENFTSHLNRTRASTLDFRKISYVKGPDETWSDIFEVAPSFRHVTKVQLPKISAHLLIALASKLPSSLESLSASNVSKELDLEELVESTSGLRELRLKSLSSGPLRISSTLSPLRSLNLTSLSLLSLEGLSDSDLREISALSDLRELSLGDVTGNANIFQELSKLGRLKNLRLESVHVNASLQCMEACPLEKLELVDSHLEQGFGSGFIRLRSLKKLLLIPVYKDEVAAINAEIVDFALSMPSLSHFCLGLTNEWLDSMNSILSMTADKSAPVRDSFPILVNGVCEMYSLYKLFKTLSAALPMSKVKVLRMSQQATKMQHIGALMS